MGEDGEQDAIHAGFVLKGAHGSGAAPDLSEATLDGIGGAHSAALGLGSVAEAGQQFIEIVAQASDGGRILLFESVGKAPRRGQRER